MLASLSAYPAVPSSQRDVSVGADADVGPGIEHTEISTPHGLLTMFERVDARFLEPTGG